MKILRLLTCIFLLAPLTSADAWIHGITQSQALAGLANSQTNGPSLSSLFMNALKGAQPWVCNLGGAVAQPSDLDTNGYPISTGSCQLSGFGLNMPNIAAPSQFQRAGNWVQLGAGKGSAEIFDEKGASTSPGASACSGVRSGTGSRTCNNSTCTTATGSISGATLTVTVASSCSLILYQAITNGSTFTNPFGVPTMIIGMSGSSNCPSCTGAGGTGTYLVNWSQSVASSSLIPGLYNEINSGVEKTVAGASWHFTIFTTDATNNLQAMALVHKDDLLAYAQGQLTSVIAKQRMKQANFAIFRDLSSTNTGNMTTWSTRKPPGYVSYAVSEMRASLFACSYGLYNGTTPCQTNYTLNGSLNQYSVNLGVALPTDKQTVCVQWSTTTTNTSVQFSIDNGANYFPVLAYHGSSVGTSNIVAAHMEGLVFDSAVGVWFSTVISGVSNACLNNYYPPEAFIQVNQEIGTTPWITEGYLAADPITDWMLQYALLIKNYSWSHTPIFEIPDEPWNCGGQGVGPYVTKKSAAYTAIDTGWSSNVGGHINCGTGGDINNWAGKAASLLGQVIRKVSSTYVVLQGVQTTRGAIGSIWNAQLLSTSYLAQNPAIIPIQSGCAGAAAIQTLCPTPFTQTAAYQAQAGSNAAAAGITIASYWSLVLQQGTAADNAAQISYAYCYYYQTGGCASQASIMASYTATPTITTAGSDPSTTTLWPEWYNFAQTCAGGVSCSPMTVYNYEGGYDVWGSVISTDQTSSVTGSTNASSAVLNISPNGCVANQPVSLSGLSGGTWSTAAGPYTVQSATATTCTINLDSTGLGALSSATLTYTNSANYVTYLQTQSYIAPSLGPNTTLLYNAIASTTATSACLPNACSFYPSQLGLTGAWPGVGEWFLFSPDLYGYFGVASCTSCSTTGNNLTLGGTITGIFKSGQTIIGGAIDGTTITGTCSQTGALPAGANVGDVCPISSSAVASGVTLNGTIVPGAPGSGTTSPVPAWGAICTFNGNGTAC